MQAQRIHENKYTPALLCAVGFMVSPRRPNQDHETSYACKRKWRREKGEEELLRPGLSCRRCFVCLINVFYCSTQLVRGAPLEVGLNKPWPQVSSLPPVRVPSFWSRLMFSASTTLRMGHRVFHQLALSHFGRSPLFKGNVPCGIRPQQLNPVYLSGGTPTTYCLTRNGFGSS